MAVVYKARADTILQEFPRNSSDRARLTSVTNPYSGSWLTSAPLDPLFTLHDIHFALATRLRLGLPLFDNISRCVCGATLDDNPLHFMACKNLSRIPRHDRLVQVITRVARLCGVTTQIEPRIDGEDKARRFSIPLLLTLVPTLTAKLLNIHLVLHLQAKSVSLILMMLDVDSRVFFFILLC